MRIAGQVYKTLKLSGGISDSEMDYLVEAGPEVVYELRYLPQHRRVQSAAYVAANKLDVATCRRLTRATVDHERREPPSIGFGEEPADVLAFAEYRDAIESRDEETRQAHVTNGLRLAVTEGARERLQALLPENLVSPDDEQRTSSTPLQVLRLIPEEATWRAVAVAGEWGKVAPSEV